MSSAVLFHLLQSMCFPRSTNSRRRPRIFTDVDLRANNTQKFRLFLKGYLKTRRNRKNIQGQFKTHLLFFYVACLCMQPTTCVASWSLRRKMCPDLTSPHSQASALAIFVLSAFVESRRFFKRIWFPV